MCTIYTCTLSNVKSSKLQNIHDFRVGGSHTKITILKLKNLSVVT